MEPIEVSTILGPVEVTIAQGNHCYVNLKSMVVSGVEYNGSIHMYLWDDSTWTYGQQYVMRKSYGGTEERVLASQYSRKQSVWIRRSDWLSRKSGEDGPSDSAFNVIVASVVVAVASYLNRHTHKLHDADIEHVGMLLDSAEREVNTAMAHLQALNEEYAKLEAQLSALRGTANPQPHEH